MNQNLFVVCSRILLITVLAGGDCRSDEPANAKHTLKVTVLGPDDQPLAGAGIHVAIWAKEPAKTNRNYTCDARGQALVELPNEIEILRVWVSSDRHVSLFTQWWPKMEKEPRDIPPEITLRLEKGTVIGGIVTNEEGKPIRGAKVEVMLADSPDKQREMPTKPIPNIWLAQGSDARLTDADGRWMLDNVPAGDDVEVKVMLGHPDFVADLEWGGLQDEQNVTTKAFRERTATIVMNQGVSLTGAVTGANGKSVEGAVVVWGDDPYRQRGSQEVRTDARGRYRFPPLSEGPLTVTVVAEGWAPDQQKVLLQKSDAVVDFQLEAGKKTRLRFLDANGNALPGVYVTIVRWRGGKALYNYKHPNVLDTKIPNQADKDGLFEWTWSPDDAVTYDFSPKGLRPVKGVEIAPDEEEREVTILP